MPSVSSSDMILLVLVSLFFCEVLAGATTARSWEKENRRNRNRRIVGGDFTEIDEHPWLASIQLDGSHNCGGSIISDTLILTAAHCTRYPMTRLSVRVGSSRVDTGGSMHEVVGIETYDEDRPLFNQIGNDVALLKVSPPMVSGENVRNIILAGKGHVVAPRAIATVAGWGRTTEKGEMSLVLKETQVRIVDNAHCASGYEKHYAFWFRSLFQDVIGDGEMCASAPGTSPCKGDSGSPLVVDGVQIGIVSWGRGCARPEYSGVYAKVSVYRDWIDEHSEKLQHSKPAPSSRDSFETFLEYVMRADYSKYPY